MFIWLLGCSVLWHYITYFTPKVAVLFCFVLDFQKNQLALLSNRHPPFFSDNNSLKFLCFYFCPGWQKAADSTVSTSALCNLSWLSNLSYWTTHGILLWPPKMSTPTTPSCQSNYKLSRLLPLNEIFLNIILHSDFPFWVTVTHSDITALEYLLAIWQSTCILHVDFSFWMDHNSNRLRYLQRVSTNHRTLPSCPSCLSLACQAHSDLLVITSWLDPRTDWTAWMHTDDQGIWKSLHCIETHFWFPGIKT